MGSACSLSGRWQCSLCGPLPALPAAAQQSALSQKEMAAACRLLSELYSAFQPAIYFKSLESLAVSGLCGLGRQLLLLVIVGRTAYCHLHHSSP